MATQATISPDIMRWARHRNRLTPERLAKSAQTKVGRVREWENGDSQPTYLQAQQLAKALRIPLAYLYLSSPPSESLPIPDLRTLPTDNRTDPSTDFLAVLNEARRKQDWYREYLQTVSAPEVSFVGSFAPSDDPRDVAWSMRDSLSVDETMQSESTT